MNPWLEPMHRGDVPSAMNLFRPCRHASLRRDHLVEEEPEMLEHVRDTLEPR